MGADTMWLTLVLQSFMSTHHHPVNRSLRLVITHRAIGKDRLVIPISGFIDFLGDLIPQQFHTATSKPVYPIYPQYSLNITVN